MNSTRPSRTSATAPARRVGGRQETHRKAVMRGYDRAAGKLPDFRTTHPVWEETGRLLGIMGGQRKDQVDRLAGSLVNDLLVAISARAIGAEVVTLNSDDFTAIRRYLSFGLEILKA